MQIRNPLNRNPTNKRKIANLLDESTSKEASNQSNKKKLLTEDSTSKESPPPSKKSKIYEFELQGQFKKIKPLIFDGETQEGAKAWLLNMSKYFQVYNHPSNFLDWLFTN